VGRRLVAAEEQASVAVVGPTGCGKTAGLVIPGLLEWRGPVLATSVKGDLVEATLGHRAGRGRVWVYDPTGASGATAAGWSPLAACRSWAGAQRVAAWLCEAARPSGGSLADADYWYGHARKALAPYLHAAALSDRTMADVVRWIDLEEVAAVEAVLSRAVPDVDAATGLVEVWPPGQAPALAAAQSLWRKEERLRSSILATVENVIAGYADPGVAALDAAGLGDGGIDLEEWLSGDNTIYVVAAAHDQARLRPVLAVLVADALRRAFDRANATGGKLVRPCLAMLDEAGTIAPVAELPTWAATARSHGISLVTVWQDLAQLRARYGPSAATVLNNHRAKVFGGGIADGGTLDYLSGLVGEERVVERTTSADVVGERRSMSEQISWRRAAPPDALRRLGTRQALLVYGAELPVRLSLRPWFADRRLRALGTAVGF
jgi:type IV secretion system protein VirD4